MMARSFTASRSGRTHAFVDAFRAVLTPNTDSMVNNANALRFHLQNFWFLQVLCHFIPTLFT